MRVDAATGVKQPAFDQARLAPLSFHAKGRDGKTDIWGVIHLPANFDPTKKYPVMEDIYAGPHGSFVPKSFSRRTEPLTQLGFVVVQIDGMGTNTARAPFMMLPGKTDGRRASRH